MEVDGTLVRALAAVGGRSLAKTTELLAGSLVGILSKASMRSNGSTVTVYLEKGKVQLVPDPGNSVMRGKYYLFQEGSVKFKGEEKLLERLKKAMLSMATSRREYLLERYDEETLDEYGLSMDYILKLEENIRKLKIR